MYCSLFFLVFRRYFVFFYENKLERYEIDKKEENQTYNEANVISLGK